MRRFAILLFILAFIGAGPKGPEIVSIVPGQEVQMHAGGQAEYALNFKILSGFHVQANPASEQYLIPTSVSLEQADGIVPQAPIYPKGKGFKLQGSDKEILTYEDENTIRIPLKADDSTIP